MLTALQLKQIAPTTPFAKREKVLPELNRTAKTYGINNELRMAAWLATLCIESMYFRYTTEIASGAAYEGRKDLGNTERGDGKRFKGRGLPQITGRANYRSYTAFVKKTGHLPFIDFEKHPERLADYPYAVDCAGWFFAVHIKANQLADSRKFLEIQLRVNGGRNRTPPRPNHWAERQAVYKIALQILPDDFGFIEMQTRERLARDEPVEELITEEREEDLPPDFDDTVLDDKTLQGQLLESRESRPSWFTKTITGAITGLMSVIALLSTLPETISAWIVGRATELTALNLLMFAMAIAGITIALYYYHLSRTFHRGRLNEIPPQDTTDTPYP